MQVSNDIIDLGAIWKGIIRSDEPGQMLAMYVSVEGFADFFLPSLKKYIENFYASYTSVSCNIKSLNKIIKFKSNLNKKFIKMLDGYNEIRRILITTEYDMPETCYSLIKYYRKNK